MHENHIVADVITHTFSKTNQNKSHLANIDPEFSTGPCGLQHHSEVDTILHLRRLFVEPAAVVMKAIIEYRDTDISERRALLQRWTLQDIMTLAQPVISFCLAKRGDPLPDIQAALRAKILALWEGKTCNAFNARTLRDIFRWFEQNPCVPLHFLWPLSAKYRL
ncbi:hypothetical protein C8J56DRAFT_202073 [Mycena floridula]|nr:hypothetical protein C8J56DRAFT_202073 [Mycena floridula]